MELEKIEDSLVREAAAALVKGGIAVYPTETFYALGGDPASQQVVDRIYMLKGREFSKPLPLIAADLSAVLRAVSQWPRPAEILAGLFWPGPLTLVLPASSSIPPRVHGHTGRLAVRISPHPTARCLAEVLGGLIISTSANLSGEPPCRILSAISPAVLEGVDAVVSGGELPGLEASTIVDLTGAMPKLVRQGVVPWGEVCRTLGLESGRAGVQSGDTESPVNGLSRFDGR